ncbi:TPA: hypothetical protein ACK3Q6_008157 [Burkholderia cepacia]|jgi:hypothetical protein|uniref:Uncharacterized protein n=3 Tax=Burkholderia cepacia complex TaxID=87882 RepID=A0A250LLT5_9BURK|nr:MULTISPECIES: hypothetical protein [Burkholderia]HDR9760289.1 hypothetical protein [Burkholderia cepacia ATCC 25416]KKL36357.1 hypothetical protein WR31_24430 [Burkholderia contaminans LMG 23361]MBA9834841.1 hypothetical protein [Burkholderia contaminans]MBA9842691.1 hypothetical protein [Burkholderia contaminans]MBA9867456.1 hypothetical protein [Burkholderia contaminans]
MIAKQLTSLWYHHGASTVYPPLESERIATLYGTDEVEIDLANGRIVLSDVGTIEVEGVASHIGEVDWIALVAADDEMSLVLGTGSPFDATGSLPTKDGVVMAIPAEVRRRMPGTLPGLPVFPSKEAR